MSKKMKLDLNALKVRSFITDLERDEQRGVRGGEDSHPCTNICSLVLKICHSERTYCYTDCICTDLSCHTDASCCV